LGGRYTVDDIKKIQYTIPLLVQGSAAPAPAATAGLTNKKFTYRLSADWTPKLTFTDQTLFYASLSSGYRNGGVNATGPKPIFAPETVTAYELGTRNTLLDNRLTLNATAFYYKYGDYQISKALNRQAFTENIDAEIKGAEFEAVFRPIEGVRLNAQIGYLDTKATNGTSINVYDRTAGNPNLTYVRTTGAAGCVVPTSLAVTAQTAVNATVAGLGPSPTYQQLVAAGGPVRALCTNALATGGVDQALKGRQLPQAPHWTVALGAQYQWDITGAWKATARVDYYRRSDSYSRIYNTISDKVPAYDNTNISLVMANPTLDLDVQLFVKNVGNNTSITNIYLSDEAAAFTRNVFLLDPRTYGISVTKRF
jgi:outer membrane receptor protein involved in Fe transport